jgi:hypothetical protein
MDLLQMLLVASLLSSPGVSEPWVAWHTATGASSTCHLLVLLSVASLIPLAALFPLPLMLLRMSLLGSSRSSVAALGLVSKEG